MGVVLVSMVAALVALLGALGTWGLARRRRLRRARVVAPLPVAEARVGASPPALRAGVMVCPSCRREFSTSVRFCPADARPLVPAGEAARHLGTGVSCPLCRRSFDAGTRFCPFDAEELIPLGMVSAMPPPSRETPTTMAGVMGKICPTCGQKYELDATFCARDGAELVAVN